MEVTEGWRNLHS